MSTLLLRIQQQAQARLHASGTMARIDARKAKHNRVAQYLGYRDAQEAFQRLGKEFITFANNQPDEL